MITVVTIQWQQVGKWTHVLFVVLQDTQDVSKNVAVSVSQPPPYPILRSAQVHLLLGTERAYGRVFRLPGIVPMLLRMCWQFLPYSKQRCDM